MTDRMRLLRMWLMGYGTAVGCIMLFRPGHEWSAPLLFALFAAATWLELRRAEPEKPAAIAPPPLGLPFCGEPTTIGTRCYRGRGHDGAHDDCGVA